KVLQHFTRDETQRVTRAMAKLNGIKSDSARGVIQNFFEDFREHSGIRGASKEYLSNTLRKALGNDLAKGLLNNLYGDEIRNNMQRLQWVEAETLARFIVNEHPQMQAIFLAYLPADSSSAVLKHLPQDYHDEIIFRIAQLQDIDHQVATDLHELVETESNAIVKGAWLSGDNRVVLVAENLENVADVRRTLRHEFIAHNGLYANLDVAQQAQLTKKVNSLRNVNSLKGIFAEVDKSYRTAPEDVKAEEVIAKIAETESSVSQRILDKV
ncbi:hypothetical protein R8O11_26640, partial [Vibrio sp. 1288]|nr:hypothetical protein [Vibrio sp. 1288]